MENYLILPERADIRAARNRLNMKQQDFADICNISIITLSNIESEKNQPSKKVLEKITNAFAEAGIYFLPGGGFRVDRNVVTIYEGQDSIPKVLENILQACIVAKDEVLFLGIDDKRTHGKALEGWKKIYEAGIPCKNLISNENNFILGPLECYRQSDSELFLSKDVVIIYKNKVVFFLSREGNFDEYILTSLKLITVDDKELAETFRLYFYRLWNNGKQPTKSDIEQLFFGSFKNAVKK